MKVWGFIYRCNGEDFALEIHGTEEEARQHVENFSSMGIELMDGAQVTAHIDYDMEVVKGNVQ